MALDHVTLWNDDLRQCDARVNQLRQCARVAGNSGFWEQGAGEGRREWESGNKASRENFLFFETEHHVHIVKLDAAFPL